MTIEELRDFEEKSRKDRRMVEFHTNQAISFKKIYQLTEGRKGIYKLLHKWAKKRNEYHCRVGTDLAMRSLKSTETVLKTFDVTKQDMKDMLSELVDEYYDLEES